MSCEKTLGSRPSILDVGVPQRNLQSPASDPVDTVLVHKPRKRKHPEIDHCDRVEESLSIQANSSLPSSKALQLTPGLLLHRSLLPLAYLDQVGSHTDNHGPRLFSAHINALEPKFQVDKQVQPIVLIAQSIGDGRLHAIERVQDGIYALCKLGSWVTLRALKRLSAQGCDHGTPRKIQTVEQDQTSACEWWRVATVEPDRGTNPNFNTSFIDGKPTNVRLSLQRSVQNCITQSVTTRDEVSPLLQSKPTETMVGTVLEEASQPPEEVLELIKSQYLETLYASKTSLAYFAKGPLSRARATFHACNASPYDQSKLVQYLRFNILPLATMDTKYRETLPKLVKNLPFRSLSDDEGASMIAAIGEKARKSKKSKVGKNGLYTGENLNATRWWLGRNMSHMGCDSADAREDAIRTTLLEQRARETQLQIILACETLALEASAKDSIISSMPADLPETEPGPDKKSKKLKKPQDLATLVEILADRLCIWQSMSIDEANTSDNKTKSVPQRGANVNIAVTGNDDLRQFCVDVVLPFYGARLSNLTAMLCQKLGGPKQYSPKRPALAKGVSSSTSIKPGSEIQRQQSRKPRRTLERFLTDERCASQQPRPSLSRSATDSMLPCMKREESDVSLSSIPLNRTSMHKRYSQREVDLNTAAQATEAKLKRKAKVDKELQGAIAALKRPNPRMAVKELVEDAENRIAGPSSRKSKNPVRKPLAKGVQIMATPSKNRHCNVLADLRFPRPHSASAATTLDEVPPSSVSRITGSVIKAHGSSSFCQDGAPWIGSNVLPSVEQTPTRGPTKLLGRPMSSSTAKAAGEGQMSYTRKLKSPEANPDLSLSFSLPPWPSKVQETPSKERTADHSFQQEKRRIEETPSKPSVTIQDSPKTSAAATFFSSQEQETSIYASLGWDDDADELAR